VSDLEQRTYGSSEVLFGDRGGKYPHGNTVVVRGKDETVAFDPCLGLFPRRDELPRVDRVILSHCHEDHIAGLPLFADAPVHVHERDIHGLQSLECLEDIYGYPEPIKSTFRKALVETFNYAPRTDAIAFRDGDVFDLGGVRVRIQHAPGHTRGHSLLWVEPDDLVFLADIDLSSFGPYYGDAWSSLEEFQTTLEMVREIDARWYATFHHIGVLEGREAFLERLDRFEAKIFERESRLLEFMAEPHTMDDVVEHRFVYRPGDPVGFADAVERHSMQQHVDQLLARDRLEEVEPGRYQARA